MPRRKSSTSPPPWHSILRGLLLLPRLVLASHGHRQGSFRKGPKAEAKPRALEKEGKEGTVHPTHLAGSPFVTASIAERNARYRNSHEPFGGGLVL